jgi:hypothetical protein
VGEVRLRGRHELVGAVLRHDRERHPLGVLRAHDVERRRLEVAVDADVRRRPDLEVEVGASLLDEEAEQFVQVQHPWDIGHWVARL